MDFEIRISGTRDGEPLTPAHLDIDEWITFMENAKNMLSPDKKERPKITARVEEGSVRFIFTTIPALVIQANALLGAVKESKQLTTLNLKQRESTRFFQKFANKHQLTVTLGRPNTLKEGLVIDRQTEWEESNPIWVKTELFLDGKITNIGGKSKANVHLDTKDFGNLTIAASEKYLAADKKNRIYKQQRVRIELMQNPEDLSYDFKSARLVEFIDYEDIQKENVDDYLAQLIKKSAKDWENVENSEEWLKEIRGYE
ncbi:MAG: hypothetical protein AAF960_03835 [Bacteroidota bacterium]